MTTTARSIIGKNVRLIRKKLGLSLLSFSILTDLSKASLVNIESGRKGYNLNLIDKISNFTKYELVELISQNFKPKDDIRDKLLKVYANNDEFRAILFKIPDIQYAITYKVLGSDFLNTPRETHEIKRYLKKFNWDYKGTSISTTLKRMTDKIHIEPHPSKKGTNVYSKKII